MLTQQLTLQLKKLKDMSVDGSNIKAKFEKLMDAHTKQAREMQRLQQELVDMTMMRVWQLLAMHVNQTN